MGVTGEIGEGFGAFLREAPAGKLVLVIVAALILSVIVLFLGDRITGYTYYWKVEKKLELMERLSAVSGRSISEDEGLSNLYDQIVEDLSAYRAGGAGMTSLMPSLPAGLRVYYPEGAEVFWKAVSAAALPMLFVVWWLATSAFGDSTPASSYSGAILFAVLSIPVALVIPTLIDPRVNWALNVTLQVLVLRSFVQKRKNREKGNDTA